MEGGPPLDDMSEGSRWVCPQWAPASSEERRNDVFKKKNKCSTVGTERFEAILNHSVRGTAHVARGKIWIHPFTSRQPWCSQVCHLNRDFLQSFIKWNKFSMYETVYSVIIL